MLELDRELPPHFLMLNVYDRIRIFLQHLALNTLKKCYLFVNFRTKSLQRSVAGSLWDSQPPIHDKDGNIMPFSYFLINKYFQDI